MGAVFIELCDARRSVVLLDWSEHVWDRDADHYEIVSGYVYSERGGVPQKIAESFDVFPRKSQHIEFGHDVTVFLFGHKRQFDLQGIVAHFTAADAFDKVRYCVELFHLRRVDFVILVFAARQYFQISPAEPSDVFKIISVVHGCKPFLLLIRKHSPPSLPSSLFVVGLGLRPTLI